MRTSGILTIGGAFVAILGGAFALLMLRAFFVDKGQGFVDLSGLVVGALVAAGRKRARIEQQSDDLHFSEVALALAKKNNGQVQVDQVAKASGLTREEATARMRQLTGRGLFDLDFDANGQMVWKLSPDAGRAQLAETAGRSG